MIFIIQYTMNVWIRYKIYLMSIFELMNIFNIQSLTISYLPNQYSDPAIWIDIQIFQVVPLLLMMMTRRVKATSPSEKLLIATPVFFAWEILLPSVNLHWLPPPMIVRRHHLILEVVVSRCSFVIVIWEPKERPSPINFASLLYLKSMSHNSQYGQSVLNVHRKFEVRSATLTLMSHFDQHSLQSDF